MNNSIDNQSNAMKWVRKAGKELGMGYAEHRALDLILT